MKPFMLADILYYLFQYQIFKSVLFRGGMGFLTTYFAVTIVMPFFILQLRKLHITSDFVSDQNSYSEQDTEQPYKGATPIMGGVVLFFSILFSVILWVWFNIYIVCALLLFFGFATIGLIDDIFKVRFKKKVEAGLVDKKSYQAKSDGINGWLKLGLEFGISIFVLFLFFEYHHSFPTAIQIPLIPIKNFQIELDLIFYFIFASLIIVGGANAVNLTDGLDSLATIPMLTSFLFCAAAAYISGDIEWSGKLKIIFLKESIKEITIVISIIIGALIAFLKFNSPPASIYLGDVGSLSLGAILAIFFIFAKIELYLPIVGGLFVIATLSTIIQRSWFFFMKKIKGRQYAEENRFFYKTPIHHHKQAVLSSQNKKVVSFYDKIVGSWSLFNMLHKYESIDAVNSKVIWLNHIKAIWLLIITFIIYFKVR